MKTYLLELTAYGNENSITTRISDTDTGCYTFRKDIPSPLSVQRSFRRKDPRALP